MRPLKLSQFSHAKSVETLLKKKNDLALLQSVLPFFQQLDAKRNAIGFSPENQWRINDQGYQSININYKNYLKDLINVPVYIDIPNNVSSVNEISWKSETYGGSYKNKNTQYELSAVFFNYAALHLNHALTLYLAKFDYNKDLIMRLLRVAMWAALKSVDYGNKCAKLGEMPGELEQSTIQMIYDLC